MPYIPEQRRKDLNGWDRPRTPGELNWCITDMVVNYVKHEGLSYKTLSAVRGVLIDAHDEFRRRIMDPYEDRQIIKNGEVYDELLIMLDEMFKR